MIFRISSGFWLLKDFSLSSFSDTSLLMNFCRTCELLLWLEWIICYSPWICYIYPFPSLTLPPSWNPHNSCVQLPLVALVFSPWNSHRALHPTPTRKLNMIGQNQVYRLSRHLAWSVVPILEQKAGSHTESCFGGLGVLPDFPNPDEE